MNTKEANAILDGAREDGLSLGSDPDHVSDGWYEAWRTVHRQEAGYLVIHSNLGSPPELLPWEREVVLPAAVNVLARLLEGSDFEIANDVVGNDGGVK